MANRKKRVAKTGSSAEIGDPQKQPAMNNVRKLREDRKWSQWQLAKISRLSERTIQRAEAGGQLGVTAEMALASAFGIEVSGLYTCDVGDVIDFTFLKRVVSGNALLDWVESEGEGSFAVDDLQDNEMKLVREFIESLNVWVAMWKDKEPSERVTARHIFTSTLDELDSNGLWVFAGPNRTGPTDNTQVREVKVAIVRSSNPRIIQPKPLRQLGKEMSVLMVYATARDRSGPA